MMDKQVCKSCLRETFVLIQARPPHRWVCGRCFGQLSTSSSLSPQSNANPSLNS